MFGELLDSVMRESTQGERNRCETRNDIPVILLNEFVLKVLAQSSLKGTL